MRPQATLVASTGSVQNSNKPISEHCDKNHFGECRIKKRACFRCGSTNHFLKDCLDKVEVSTNQAIKLVLAVQRGRRSRTGGTADVNRGRTEDKSVRFEAHAPARAYVIWAAEESDLD